MSFWLYLALMGFAKITKFLARNLEARGVKILMCLDDWLILAPSTDHALEMILTEARRLGFLANHQKFILCLTQSIDWL